MGPKLDAAGITWSLDPRLAENRLRRPRRLAALRISILMRLQMRSMLLAWGPQFEKHQLEGLS